MPTYLFSALMILFFSIPTFAGEKIDLQLLVGAFQAVQCEINKKPIQQDDLKNFDLEAKLDGNRTLSLYTRVERLSDPVKRYEFPFIDQGRKTYKGRDEWGCSKDRRKSVTTRNGVRYEGKYKGYLICGPIPTVIQRERIEFNLLDPQGLRASLKYQGSAFLSHSCIYERVP